MALTRRGVAYNLDESPYRLEVPYEDQTLVYVFSSDWNRRRFYDGFLDNREKVSESLSRRFGFEIQNDLISDVRYYGMIEKRGFLIVNDGVKMLCQDDITLDGAKLMKRS